MTSYALAIPIVNTSSARSVLESFPHLAYAVKQVAGAAQARWMGYAGGAPLPNGRAIQSRTGVYLRSIQSRQLSAFAHEVFSDAPHAKALEEGMPAYDMKRMLNTSLKVRVNAKGERYLIIPFRWGTPGAVTFGANVMTHEVMDLWRTLKASRVTGMGKRASGTGAYDIHTRKPIEVDQRKYQWGGRVTKEHLSAADVHGQAARRMTGMVHFQDANGGHGQYLTFRVMSEKSSGWITRAVPGFYPARATADWVRKVAPQAFSEAAKMDIQNAIEERLR